MASSIQITTLIPNDSTDIQRVSARPAKAIEIVEYKDSWTADFAAVQGHIRTALGDRALTIEHVGSTSVPGLPAKAVIDVDLVVSDPTAEDTYVADLETAGFQFLFREPGWFQRRFFGLQEPYTNLHVFGPDATEVVRHRIFRDWLREHEDDRIAYADVKRKAAEASRHAGETEKGYNDRKATLIKEILQRAFKADGLLS